MMNTWQDRLFRLSYAYSDLATQKRAELAFNINWVLISAAALLQLFTIINIIANQSQTFTGVLIGFVAYFAFGASQVLLQRGAWRGGAIITLLLLLFSVAAGIIQPGDTDSSINTSGTIIGLTLPIVYAGLTLGSNAVIGTTGAISLVMFIGWLRERALPEANNTLLTGNFFSVTATFLVIGLLIWLFSERLGEIAEIMTRESQKLRHLLSESTRTENPEERPEVLIGQATDLLSRELGHFARVFLTDEQGVTIKRVINTSLGIEREETADTISESGGAILEVLRQRKLMRIDLRDPESNRTHFYPGARSGLLIPLLYGNRLVGILDVQSTQMNSFDPEETSTLLLLTSQLAERVTQHQQLNKLNLQTKEQETSIQRHLERLRQYEQADQKAILNAWSTYLSQRGQTLFGFDLHEFESRVVAVEDLNDTLRSALSKGEVVIQDDGLQQHVSIPIMLRGQVLGAISLTLPLNRPVTRRQMEMISSVVQRLAFALENKRLFEQSQSQAQRESRANEIAALLLSTTDVETVLSLAANRFNEALGAIQTRIHLTGSSVIMPSPREEKQS